MVAPLIHSYAPLTLSAKTKNKVYPCVAHVVTPPLPPPAPTHLERHREVKCGETLVIYQWEMRCVCISMCMFVLLSPDPPSTQMKPPLTSGSSQPATTDHTCVPSATHAHTQNLTLIVGNVSALLCCGQ